MKTATGKGCETVTCDLNDTAGLPPTIRNGSSLALSGLTHTSILCECWNLDRLRVHSRII